MTDRGSFNPSSLDELLQMQEDGEPGLVESLVSDFQVRSQDLLEQITLAVREGNWPELERNAHSLKSSMYLLGLERAADLAAQIEDDACAKRFKPVVLEDARAELKVGLTALVSFVDEQKERA